MAEETLLQSKFPANAKEKYLLDHLSARFKYQTREAWLDLIQRGKVTVNGSPVRPFHPLRKGDLISYSVLLKEPPVDRNIRILHEEEGFLVASKPGQLPSHADGNYIKNTFIHILTQSLRQRGWEGQVMLVHRLDRETSGLMVVAKDKEAHLRLTRQFESGQVAKEYLAVVRGKVDWERNEVEGSIGRDMESSISIRQKMVPEGTPFSKPSRTGFEKVLDLREGALIRCLPRTGRTNQIRVHLSHLGHPLVGDKLYGRTDEEFLDFLRHVKAGGDPGYGEKMEVPRHLLHASRLAFRHPMTGAEASFEAPLPQDLKTYLEDRSLRK